jgi:hypothetical protein
MIKNKTFITTSGYLLTAALLSQVYSYSSNRIAPKTLNLSAFKNLSENINALSIRSNLSEKNADNILVMDDIVSVINKEITNKIVISKYAINSLKKNTEYEKVTVTEFRETILNLKDSRDFEINNKELINLYAFSIDKVAFNKFESSNLAFNFNNEIKDEVVVAQASTENGAKNSTDEIDEIDEVKTIQHSVKNEKQESPKFEMTTQENGLNNFQTTEDPKEAVAVNDEDEMVMFDYAKATTSPASVKTIDQRLYERKLSNTVKGVISREIGSKPVRQIPNVSTRDELVDTDDMSIQKNEDGENEQITYDYSNTLPKNKEADSLITTKALNAFVAQEKNEALDTQFAITAKEINLSTHKIRKAHSFEFIPDYDRAERNDDESSGEIHLGYSLNGEMNTQTGIIQARGVIPTRVELNIGSVEALQVPLISEDGIQRFLEKQGLAVEGNLILLALNSNILDTEVNSNYGHKIFFDENFKSLNERIGASYVMFAGVKTGTIMLKYLLNNKETAQKVIYVGDGEMYFEDSQFTENTREMYTFTTRNLMGQKQKELVINGSDISFFNTNINAKKKALNAYEIKIPTLVSGMRKYLEFKHLKDNILVGSSSEKNIEIPGNEFIGKVLEMNQVDSLKERCVVQVNLSKKLSELKSNGKNRSGEMLVETSFLDSDGNFSRDSELAEKAFIVGDMEGLFNIRLNYTDGSTEFLKTFCTQGTYLVEQL